MRRTATDTRSLRFPTRPATLFGLFLIMLSALVFVNSLAAPRELHANFKGLTSGTESRAGFGRSASLGSDHKFGRPGESHEVTSGSAHLAPTGDAVTSDHDVNSPLATELLINGNFETGTLAGWTTNFTVQSGSTASVSADVPGTTTPISTFTTAANASGGTTYAVTDENGPASHSLLQSFTVPAGTSCLTLSYQMFVNDYNATPVINPAGLDITATPNQHARVDLLTAGATPFSTAPADVIQTFYLGNDSGTNPHAYSSYAFDITPYVTPGQTYKIRFASVDTVNFMNVGVDNVSIMASSPACAGTPSITSATTNEDVQTTSGLVISRNAGDGTEVTHFKINLIGIGTLFQHDGTTPIANGDFITFAQANAGLRYTPSANTFIKAGVSAQSSLSNTSAGLKGSAALATITVNPAADTPSVTNSATNVNTQTQSGLVITRNVADGSEVTHFKITNITSGTLFQNDGTTAITNNSFITVAQGNAGLKFTPAANFTGTASFQVQASLSNLDAGLGGTVVIAQIIVFQPSAGNLLNNGDFELGSILGWTSTTSGDGNFFADTPGTTTPTSSHTTAANVLSQTTYAVSDEVNVGVHTLRQSFTVPAGATNVTLSYQMFVNDYNNAAPIINPAGLTTGSGANQHARVDLLTAAATAFSTAPADVVHNFYLGNDFALGANPHTFSNYVFDITPFVTPGQTYQLRFADALTQNFINVGVDNVTVVATVPTGPFSIGGHVTYANGTTPGKNVTMTLVGTGGFVTQTAITNASGDYSFSSIPGGNSYTLTPSKTGDNATGLQSLDAAFAARYVAGLDIPTASQLIAADADGDGVLTSLDASFIARRAAGLSGTGIVGTWKFAAASRSYPALSANQTAQNFTAILVGDTSGDWTPAITTGGGGDNHYVSSLPRPAAPLAVNVSLPNVTGPTGSNITVPITVDDLTGQGVKAYDLQVTFDPTKVVPQGTPFDTAGTVSSGMLITPNSGNPGHLVISAFQATDISGAGTLINLKFTIIGAPGQQTALTFADYTDPGTIFHPGFRFNAGTPAATTSNGSIHINGPTAATGTIAGRITSEDGTPVSGAVINLSGAQNRKTITDTHGYYSFDHVEAGDFYTVTPSRANYGFSPGQRSFSLQGNRTESSFTGIATGDTANPLETPEYFVRQQYVDLLGREPDEAGFNYWSNQINQCLSEPPAVAGGSSEASASSGSTREDCLRARRIDVAAAFFMAQEFQDTGAYLYNVYRGALGRQPLFTEYSVDRQAVVGGAALESEKAAFARSFVERPEFVAKYEGQTTAELFVEALLHNAQAAGVDLSSQRDDLLSRYQDGGNQDESRVAVVRSLAENAAFKQAQYNAAFVLTEYFSYLQRDAEAAGFEFWLNVLNNREAGNYRGMVCSFVTAAEYQHRFGVVVARSNSECR